MPSKLRARMRPWPEEHRRWCAVAGGLPEVMPLAISDDLVIGVMQSGQQILVHRQNLLGLKDGYEALGKNKPATRSGGKPSSASKSAQEKSYEQMASALSRIPKARLMVLLGIDKEQKK